MTAFPSVVAVCELSPPLEEERGVLVLGEAGSGDGLPVPILLGQAMLSGIPRPGEGWLRVDGYAAARVSWTARGEDGPGRCSPEPVILERDVAVITGLVSHEDGGGPARDVHVQGCGGSTTTDGDGAYYMEVVPGPCQVLVWRSDGQLTSIGEIAEVSPELGRDLVVDLVIPGFPRAGLGIGVALHDEGFSVDRVLEGTAAEEAGLQEGDIIIALDGEPVVDMELGEFVELAGGREGSRVALTVKRDGEEQLIEMERRPVR